MVTAYFLSPVRSNVLTFQLICRKISPYSGLLSTPTPGPSYYNFVQYYDVGTQIFLAKSPKANLNGE